MSSTPCRCGHTGIGPHPCHAKGHTCRKPALQRFYAPRLAALAGVQMKIVMTETWACDDCWVQFGVGLKAAPQLGVGLSK